MESSLRSTVSLSQVTRLIEIVSQDGEVIFTWSPSLPTEHGFPSLRDNVWSTYFGPLQESLANESSPKQIAIDFSELGWADPLPLLAIATAAVGAINRSDCIVDVQLGETVATDSRRGGFLRFIAEHRF